MLANLSPINGGFFDRFKDDQKFCVFASDNVSTKFERIFSYLSKDELKKRVFLSQEVSKRINNNIDYGYYYTEDLIYDNIPESKRKCYVVVLQ